MLKPVWRLVFMQQQTTTTDPVSRRTGLILTVSYGIIPFVMVPDAADLVAWPRLVVVGLMLAVGLGLTFRKSSDPLASGLTGVLPRPVVWALGAFILMGAVGIFTAHNRFFAGYETARMLVFAGWLMLVAHTLQNDKTFLPRLLRVLSVIAIVNAAVGLAQLWGGWLMWIPPGTYPPFGFMASSNYFGESMLLLSVLSAGSVLLNQGLWRWVGVAGLVLGLVATVMARARTVHLGLAAVLMLAAFCALALYLRERKDGDTPLLLRASVRWILFVLLLVGMGAAGYVLRKDKFDAANIETVRVINDSEVERVVIWRESIHMTKEHPLVGVGPGNWKFHVLERGIVSGFQGFATRYFIRGHNDFLQSFAERGLIGGLAFLGLWLLGFGYGIRRLERSESRREGIQVSIALCGLLGWAIIACFGFPMERTEECLLWLLFLAMSLPEVSGKKSSFGSKMVVGFLIAVSIGFVILTSLIVQADRHGFQISLAKQAQDWYSVHREAKAADHWYYPSHSINNTPIEWYIGTAALVRGDRLGGFPYLEKAWHKHPWHPHVASNYAAALYGEGKQVEAVEVMENLLVYYPEFHEVRVNLNEIYLIDENWNKVNQNLTYWEKSVKPRDISLYLEQVKVRMDSVLTDTNSNKK